MDNSNPLKQPIRQADANPLAQYYRKPGTYISLPSQGKFFSNIPKMSDDRELAVYPMTANDELILKNPDNLLNGEALKKVIASVCPDIADINEIPAPDIDAILVAMRMTSYGDDMELDVSHGCVESNGRSQRITVSLGSVLSTLKAIPDSIGNVTLSNGITVKLKPYTLEAQSKLLKAQFNAMRQVQAAELTNKSIEEQANIANLNYELLSALSVELLAKSIILVTLPDGNNVTRFDHIFEWVKNLDRASSERLDTELKEFNNYGITRTVEVKCEHCGNTFNSDMLFDPTSFFNVGS